MTEATDTAKRLDLKRIQKLEEDFETNQNSFLELNDLSWMVRGDAELYVPQFIVALCSNSRYGTTYLEIAPLDEEGKRDVSRKAASFYGASTGAGGEVRSVESSRHERPAAVQAAKLLLPEAVRAQPLPVVNKAIAQLIIDQR